MKAWIGGIGAVLMYVTLLWATFVGIIMLYASLGWIGVVAGVIVFPLSTAFGLGIWFFSSWSSFIGSVIWFGLLSLMIYIGKDE